jgi:hypothetical protein
MNEWNIQSRAHACEACTRPFADQQPYHTLLLDAAPDLRRLDICEPCWQKQFAGDARSRAGFISHWQGVYEAPPAQPVEAIQKETAETVLRKLVEQNDPRYAPAAYILAVMLERKRLLKVKEQITRDGRRIFIYEQPGTGDIFTIADPDLHLNQLEAVQHDVAQLLEHGLNPPAPAPETPAVPEPASDSEPPPTEENAPAVAEK